MTASLCLIFAFVASVFFSSLLISFFYINTFSMTPKSAPVTSNHEFIMADGVSVIFSILFSLFFLVFLTYHDGVFWLLCILTVFGVLAGNLIFMHSGQNM